MTKEEFYALLSRLRAEHETDFDRWYEGANYQQIKACCEMGFLLGRFYLEIKSPGQ